MRRLIIGCLAGIAAFVWCLGSAAQNPAGAAAKKTAVKSPATAEPGTQIDRRPFGRYLLRVCELGKGCYDPSDACHTGSCPPAPKPAPAPAKAKQGKNSPPAQPPDAGQKCRFCDTSKMLQAIKLKQLGCDGTVISCDVKAEYPLTVGKPFYIQATSSAKEPDGTAPAIALDVDGPATKVGDLAKGIQTFLVTGEGAITVSASRDGNDQYLPAPKSSITLQTADAESRDCFGLYTGPSTTTDQPDIAAISSLVGNPSPFVLQAQGIGTILIYATRFPDKAHPEEAEILKRIVDTLDGPLGGDATNSFGIQPASPQPKPFSTELSILHAAALGDPAASINALKYKFAAQNIGSKPGRVRISSSDQPSCKDWKTFLHAVRDLQWSVFSTASVTKLWHLSADDAASKIGILFPAPASPPAPAATPASAPSGSAAPPSSNATVSVNQPPGSKIEIATDTTPCVVAGLAVGNSNACAPSGSTSGSPSGSSGGSSPDPNPIPSPQSIVAASLGIPNGTPQAGQLPVSPNDLLVYGNPTPGNDAQIEERNRILAQLDLPRPELIINAWVTQNSSSDPRAMGSFNRDVRRLVDRYNDSIETMLLTGFQQLSTQMQDPTYFNDPFYHYVSDLFVAEGSGAPISTAQEFLSQSPSRLVESGDDRTSRLGICAPGKYCLGYSWLFRPIKPRLTDMLLALIAADQPFDQAIVTIDTVQGTGSVGTQHRQRGQLPDFTCTGLRGNARGRCETIQDRLALGQPVTNYLDPETDCSTADKWGILESQFTGLDSDDAPHPPRVYLACFARAVRAYFLNAGLARATVADFLFQYKRSQQYPHEFSPYLLSQSAAKLNSVLGPVIDAFNRDIVAFQAYMRTDLEYEIEVANRGNDERCCLKRLFGLDKPSFFNDSIITVRTISGQSAQVSTTSQTFLDASQAPSLSDLVSAVGAAPASSPASGSPLAGVLGASQTPVSLLSGLLSSYQKSTVQIGRQLQLQAVPRSLATGSSAEISVALTAGDPVSSPPVFSGQPGSAQQQNLSEVSSHQVTTRIRVDSVRLFDLSAYSAVLERSRSKFPLLPPFVEIPYIGTIAGIPLRAAKEYHASTAILSAMVVPTASDIGYGLRFFDDLFLYDPPGACSFTGQAGARCRIRNALSYSDLHAPITKYHNAMMLCLMTESAPGRKKPTIRAASANFLAGAGEKDACGKLTFDQLESDE